METQGKRSKALDPCEFNPRGQSCRRGRREEREPTGRHLRFLVVVQVHDLDTGCTGGFGVLQSENGDKSTGVVFVRESLREEVRSLWGVIGRGMGGMRGQRGV